MLSTLRASRTVCAREHCLLPAELPQGGPGAVSTDSPLPTRSFSHLLV